MGSKAGLGRIAAVAGWILALALLGCGGGGAKPSLSSADDSLPSLGTQAFAPGAPTLAKLQARLVEDLRQRGMDAAKAVAYAPRGESNAVFDLAATVVDPDGAGGADPTGIELTWTEVALGDYDQAQKAYAELLKAAPATEDEPGSAAPLNPRYAFPGRPYRRMTPLPGEDYLAYQSAEMLFREGKIKEAEQAFAAMAQEHVESPYANDALERVLLVRKFAGNPPGEEAYREGLKAYDRGEANLAEHLLATITAPPLGDAALLLLAEVQLWEDKREAALATCDALAARFPDSPLAAQALYRAACVQAGPNPADALQRIESLLKQYPDSAVADEAAVLKDAIRRKQAAVAGR